MNQLTGRKRPEGCLVVEEVVAVAVSDGAWSAGERLALVGLGRKPALRRALEEESRLAFALRSDQSQGAWAAFAKAHDRVKGLLDL